MFFVTLHHEKNELIEFLQRQVGFLQGKLDEALASVSSLTLSNEKLTATVDELRRQIASLENVIKGNSGRLSFLWHTRYRGRLYDYSHVGRTKKSGEAVDGPRRSL